MTTWNHRVMRRTIADDGHGQGDYTFDGVYEVFYDEDGKVNGWTEDPMSPIHDLSDEDHNIVAEIERFATAATKPILSWHTGLEIDK